MTCGQEAGEQIDLVSAGAAGYQDSHCGTFLRVDPGGVGMGFSVSEG